MSILDSILSSLSGNGITLSQVLLTVISSPARYKPIFDNLIGNLPTILDAFHGANDESNEVLMPWVFDTVHEIFAGELLVLSHPDAGFHFSANDSTEDHVLAFDIDKYGSKQQTIAPQLCHFFSRLYSVQSSANKYQVKSRLNKRRQEGASDRGMAPREVDVDMQDAWRSEPVANDEEDVAGLILGEEEDEPENLKDQLSQRRSAILKMRQICTISNLMHSVNHRCNILQATVGIFLHTNGTAERVYELFSRIGLSVSSQTVNNAVNSLSLNAEKGSRQLGQSLRATYAYDNLDIDLKSSTYTVENANDPLIHLTTATVLPLHPDITLEDLDCASSIWETSEHNPDNTRPRIALKDLMGIHPETLPYPADGFIRRPRFNAWKFLHDLVNYGPKYFHGFKKQIGQPELVDEIPIVKTDQVPLRAMDISPSTAAANADALEDMFKQGGISGPGQPQKRDIGNHITMVFGDLLTGERIRSLADSRSIESTPWNRLENVIYVMGLFHFRMAAADAIWRIHIEPAAARGDKTSLIELIAQIRPKETGKFKAGPKFRPMHEAIQHVGIVSRLDIFEAVVKKHGYNSLLEFGETSPTLEVIKEYAKECALDHVSAPDIGNQPPAERDAQLENSHKRQKHFLLYEEIVHAMNIGDIGRLETCFLPWAFIFQGCGKHKYATELIRYMTNVHFVYPAGLRQAVCYSILINPTGLPGKWRAVDWLVEHNNLYTKRIYGGRFSNKKKHRILQESALIQVYKNIQIQFETMFCINQRSIYHSPAEMENTFKRLLIYMQKEKVHQYVAGRKSNHPLPDIEGKGQRIAKKAQNRGAQSVMGLNDTGAPDAEVEDNGDLDV